MVPTPVASSNFHIGALKMMTKEQAFKTRDLLVKHWFTADTKISITVESLEDSDTPPDTWYEVLASMTFSCSLDKVSMHVTQPVLSPGAGHNVYMAWNAVVDAYHLGATYGKRQAVKQIQSVFEREVFPQ